MLRDMGASRPRRAKPDLYDVTKGAMAKRSAAMPVLTPW